MGLKSGLEWLGRHGTKVAAASILIGLILPPLAAWLRPAFTPAIFLLLVFAFLRVDPAELRARFASPSLVAHASAGIMLVLPVLFGLALPFTGINALGPGVALGMMMYLAAPPIMASTAFAALLKLDTALTLALLVVCMLATPLVSPVIVSYFAGDALTLDALQLALRLFGIVGAAMITAQLLRYLLGNEKIAANKGAIDGINALLLLFFGITSMDGVTARALREPLLVAALTGITLAVALGTYLLTTLLFWSQGLKRSLALGFSAAHRNMGVMIAAAGSGLPELTWIYFAVAQFPIFLLPMLSAPVVHRLMERRLPEDK